MSEPATALTPMLSALRVLEFGRTVAPAFCGKLLAEMGLNVALVEPQEGHPLRHAAPRVELATGDTESALWLYLGAGKSSIVLDPQTAAGRGSLDELVTRADVIIHDLTQHGARESGLAFDRLQKLRPGIVVVAVSPFGCDGPYADFPASDLTVYALSGHLNLTGSPDREPLLPYGHQPALFAGVLCASLALAGLYRSTLDGVARFIEISQQEALAGALDTAISGYTYSGKMRTRHGNRIQDGSPLTDVYRTKDGFFLICVYTQEQWRGFCTMLGRSDWLENDALTSQSGRIKHAATIEAAMISWFGGRKSSEALMECQRHRLPSCMVSSVTELLNDPQLLARDHFAQVDCGAAGIFAYPKLPFVMSSCISTEAPPPRLGEHGDIIRQTWTARSGGRSTSAYDPPLLPLAGIRVLDVTHAWAGPFCGLQLGFLGAEMIKIEGARRPDGTRYVCPDLRDLSPRHETGGYFHEWNRNKRCAVINMDAIEGRDLMHDLIRRSDVLINNYSARVLPKWGLDWQALRTLNPRLVLVTMPAFGSQGPYREFVGYGETLEGAGGLVRLSGYEAGKPMRSGIAYPDPLVGHYGALATVLGLQHREKTGEGIWIDVSHQECVLHMIGDALLHYQLTGVPQEPRGNLRADLLLNEVLPCAGKDNWIAVTAASPGDMAALAEATDIEALANGEVSEAALDDLRAWCRAREKRAAMACLVGKGVAAGAVLKVDELFQDPNLVARQYFEDVRHAVVGVKPHPRPGFRIAGATVATHLAAPLFDGDTDAILTTVLGKNADEIDALRRRNIIGGVPAGSQLPT